MGMSLGDLFDAVVADPALLNVGGATSVGAYEGGAEGARKGAALDLLGLAVGTGLAAAMAPEASAASAGGTITSGGAAGTTAVAAPEAASTTSALAQETLGAGPAAGTAAADNAAAAEAGMLPATAPASSSPGLINSGLGFVKENPVASVLGLQAVGGVGKSIADRAAMREKLKEERANAIALEEERIRRIQSGSAGGRGVNLNVRPGSKVLRRADGTPVYGGLINSAMGG